MTPRAGGEADKFGNRYEGAWTVRQLFEVLLGNADAITVEATGETGSGVEFILECPDAPNQVHQVKRQRGSANSWTLRALETEGVLVAAARHGEAGREFHFVSTVPSRRLDRLADRARRSNSLEHFIDGFLDGNEITDDFNYLASTVWSTPQRAWEILRRTRVRWPDERELRATNSALAGMILAGGEPALAWLGLGDLILNDLGLRLSLDALSERLEAYGLRIDPLAEHADLRSRVGDLTAAWLEGVGAELLEPRIARGEADDILAGLTEEMRLVIATGNAGDGKSAVLHQVVERLGAEDWPLLAFRLDRLDPFRTASELGERLELPSSPASVLAALAGDGPALLVIDQLDAVSLLSGRMPASFDGVTALLREVAAFPEIRVLLACREFDIQNDNRLRRLTEGDDGAEKVTIGPLSVEQVAAALVELGLDPGGLDAAQLDLLRSPLHLVLLAGALPEEGALSFTSTKDLFDLFWASKARAVRHDRDPAPRFTEVIDVLIDAMSASQRLAVPDSELDSGDLLADADVLASEHVLVRDANRIAFFHEAFFDYAFARRWIRRGESLVQFLAASEQELFRRSQVRQVLNHLRDEDPGRFTAEFVELLRSDDVRFHVKDVVLRLLGALPDPSHEDWLAVSELLSAGLSFEDRLWGALRSPGWFHRLSSEGVIERWLGEDSGLRNRALDILISAVRQHPDEVAHLIAAQSSAPGYPQMLLAAARFAELHASRELFDLLLQAVREGQIDASSGEVWIDLHGLAKEEPEWAIEFLCAHFAERPGHLELDSEGKVTDLGRRDHTQLELITDSAASRPLLFCEELLPYLLDAMAATSEGGDRPLADRHFTYRTWRADIHTVDDALLQAMRASLRALGESEPEALAPFIDALEADPHDGAQYLLYEALGAAGPPTPSALPRSSSRTKAACDPATSTAPAGRPASS